jgi:hypothetical protein
MSRTRNARAMRMIGLAALAGLRPIFSSADDKQGGGGNTEDKNKGDDKGKQQQQEPEKLTLTKAELKAQIDEALRAEREQAAEDARKEREKKEREELEAKGELQKLLDKEREERAREKAEIRALKIERDLRDYLATKHPEYASVAKYILPQIPADTKDADLKAAIEKAAADYVKDNPRETKGSAAPAAPGRTTAKPNNGKPVNRMAGLESSI